MKLLGFELASAPIGALNAIPFKIKPGKLKDIAIHFQPFRQSVHLLCFQTNRMNPTLSVTVTLPAAAAAAPRAMGGMA